MELIAFLLALVAVYFFLAPPIRIHLGLTFLTLALIVQFILQWVRVELVVG